MRIVYALVLIAGLGAVVADHLDQPVERPRGLAGGFRRRLRAVRRAVPVDAEEITPLQFSRQKRLDLGAPRRAQDAGTARLHLIAAAAAAKRIAGGSSAPSPIISAKAPWKCRRRQRVDGVDRERRDVPQLAVFEPQHVVRAVGDGKERLSCACAIDQRAAEIVGAGGRAQALGRENDMRCERSSDRRCRDGAVGVEHDRKAALARRTQHLAHEHREAIVGQHRIGAGDQRARVAGAA